MIHHWCYRSRRRMKTLHVLYAHAAVNARLHKTVAYSIAFPGLPTNELEGLEHGVSTMVSNNQNTQQNRQMVFAFRLQRKLNTFKTNMTAILS